MTTATISSKYQIAVPKEARDKLRLRNGQKMAVIVKGTGLHYIPVPGVEDLRGFLKGMNTDDIREDSA